MLNITNGFLNAIIGGWQMGGTATWMGGTPNSLTIGGIDNSETNEGYDRPNYVSGSADASPQTTSDWYNRAAYVEAPPGNFGNVGRNTVSAPGIFGMDAEVHKGWVMPYNEHHLLTLRVEAFNVLNHPVWGQPNPNILAGSTIPGEPSTAARSGFGAISGTLGTIPMRQLQLGLKYTF